MAGAKIGFIGCGAMGRALVCSISKKGSPKDVLITDANFENAERLAAETGAGICKSNVEVVRDAKYIFLAVKPQIIKSVLNEIKNAISENSVLISMAAGVSIKTIEAELPGKAAIVRIMPNTAAQVSEAMIAVAANQNVAQKDFDQVVEILSAAGKVKKVSESLFDAVTAVSGSGPAFVYIFIESLADAAVLSGMTREDAYLYAAQTVKGAAQMVLQSGKRPSELKDAVCSPSGTTIEGVAALEKGGFRASVMDAVVAAFKKSVALGKS